MNDNGAKPATPPTTTGKDEASKPSYGSTTKLPNKLKLDDRHKQGIWVAKKLREQRKDEVNQRRPWDKQRITIDSRYVRHVLRETQV